VVHPELDPAVPGKAKQAEMKMKMKPKASPQMKMKMQMKMHQLVLREHSIETMKALSSSLSSILAPRASTLTLEVAPLP